MGFRPYCGAANLGSSRLSGGPAPVRARPRKTFRRRNQTSLHWILFYICPDPVEFRAGTDQMIVALILPEWPMAAKEKIRLMSSESLQRPQPLRGRYVRGDQEVDMVGHNYKAVEIVLFRIPIPNRFDHDAGDFRLAQVPRACACSVEQPVHRYKRSSRG